MLRWGSMDGKWSAGRWTSELDRGTKDQEHCVHFRAYQRGADLPLWASVSPSMMCMRE